FHGHVRSRAHGDANVRGGEGWCVVYAIARHCDGMALALEFFYYLTLLLRQDFGFDLLNATPLCDRVRGRTVVTRQHDDAHAILREGIQCSRRRLLYRIRKRKYAGQLSIDSCEDSCCAFV